MIHREDVMRKWIEPDVEFAAARFRRRASGRVKVLIPRIARDGGIGAAESQGRNRLGRSKTEESERGAERTERDGDDDAGIKNPGLGSVILFHDQS